MSIYNAMAAATDAKDADKLNDLYDDDFIFVRHQSNSSMTDAQWVDIVNEGLRSIRLVGLFKLVV